MSESSTKTKLQVLQFLSQNLRICVDIKYVDKVLPLVFLEAVPGGPLYLAGLMNLAGKSVPVIDLAMCFGLERKSPYSLDAPILLCSDNLHQAGIIVEKILGLSDIEENSIQMRSEFNKPESPFIASITSKNKLSLLVNMPFILSVCLALEQANITVNNKLINMANHKYER